MAVPIAVSLISPNPPQSVENNFLPAAESQRGKESETDLHPMLSFKDAPDSEKSL
jgi:hypothetical protein